MAGDPRPFTGRVRRPRRGLARPGRLDPRGVLRHHPGAHRRAGTIRVSSIGGSLDDLLLGNLWAKVHKLLAGETFAVETENGVAGVRGTEFRIEVARDQADLVRVYEGLVQVDARERGWSHSLQAGTELRFRREAEPPRPFDAESEKGHRFMEWVRSRRTREGEQPGRIRREMRSPEQEHRIRERIRERRRER